MLQLLAFTNKNIIATRADDVLAKNDYKKIQPLFYNIISTGKKVKWYFEMEDNNSTALTEFINKGADSIYEWNTNFAHEDDVEKIAIVGTDKWIKYMYAMMKPFTKAKLMYFDYTDKEKAMLWIKEEAV